MRFIVSSIIAVFTLVFMSSYTLAGELFIFAGAGLRKPTDKIIEQFQKDTGHKVIVNYGGSGKQMTKYLATRQGDLFMPGSYFYITKLAEKGLVVSDRRVVYHIPVIAVNKLGKKKIESLEDLAKPGIRLAMGDPKAMALGRTSMEIIEKADLKKPILDNVVVYGATVNQLTLYILKRTVDAAIIARSNAVTNQDKLRMIDIPKEYFTPEIIGIATLKTATNPELAEQFQRFVSSPAGVQYFEKFGFLPLDK